MDTRDLRDEFHIELKILQRWIRRIGGYRHKQ